MSLSYEDAKELVSSDPSCSGYNNPRYIACCAFYGRVTSSFEFNQWVSDQWALLAKSIGLGGGFRTIVLALGEVAAQKKFDDFLGIPQEFVKFAEGVTYPMTEQIEEIPVLEAKVDFARAPGSWSVGSLFVAADPGTVKFMAEASEMSLPLVEKVCSVADGNLGAVTALIAIWELLERSAESLDLLCDCCLLRQVIGARFYSFCKESGGVAKAIEQFRLSGWL